MTGFKIRSNTGAPWVDRKSGAKLDLGNVIPMKPTPLMDAVMSGSPDQVRQESYKQRTANLRRALEPHDDEPERAVRGHREGRFPPRHLDDLLASARRAEARLRTPRLPTAARRCRPAVAAAPSLGRVSPTARRPRLRALPPPLPRGARLAPALALPRGALAEPRRTLARRLVALLRATPQTVSHSVAPFSLILRRRAYRDPIRIRSRDPIRSGSV